MPIYNVARTVIELVEADTAEEANASVDRRLSAAGFEVYDGEQPTTFESEPLDDTEGNRV